MADAILGPFERGTAHFDESQLLYRFLAREFPGPALLVDVGAHHGGSIRSFCEDGWTVHAFEPDPENRRILSEQLGSHDSLVINPFAVAERDGERVDFYRSSESSGVSGLSPFLESHKRTATVETLTLSAYLSSLGNPHVRCLKVDTEGHDLFVLRSYPWDEDAPDAIECEFEDAKTLDLGYRADDLAGFLIDRGYCILTSEWHPIVRYGIKHDFRVLRRYQPGAIDSNAWGNFIAVRTEEHLDALVQVAREFGVEVRDRPEAEPPTPPGSVVRPPGFEASPSVVPVVAGMAERERAVSSPATAPEAANETPAAAGLRAHVLQLLRFYRSTTGILLAVALVLAAVGYLNFAFSWIFGLAGLGLLGVFLAYRIGELDGRVRRDSVAIRGRVNAARSAADTARSAVGHVHEELRDALERIEADLDELRRGL